MFIRGKQLNHQLSKVCGWEDPSKDTEHDTLTELLAKIRRTPPTHMQAERPNANGAKTHAPGINLGASNCSLDMLQAQQ
jgi:hypothetical protein